MNPNGPPQKQPLAFNSVHSRARTTSPVSEEKHKYSSKKEAKEVHERDINEMNNEHEKASDSDSIDAEASSKVVLKEDAKSTVHNSKQIPLTPNTKAKIIARLDLLLKAGVIEKCPDTNNFVGNILTTPKHYGTKNDSNNHVKSGKSTSKL